MSEVLVTNNVTKPVPIVVTGSRRWERFGVFDIDPGDQGGGTDFVVPVGKLFIVRYVAADGNYHGTSSKPAAMRLFTIESAGGPSFALNRVFPVVRRIAPFHSVVSERLEFVIQGQGPGQPSKVSVELDAGVASADLPYTVRFVLQGYLEPALLVQGGIQPVPLT